MSQTGALTEHEAASSDYERAGGGRGVSKVIGRCHDLVPALGATEPDVVSAGSV